MIVAAYPDIDENGLEVDAQSFNIDKNDQDNEIYTDNTTPNTQNKNQQHLDPTYDSPSARGYPYQ